MQISSWQRPYYHNLVDLYNGDRIDSFKLSKIATDINSFFFYLRFTFKTLGADSFDIVRVKISAIIGEFIDTNH